MEVVEVTIVQRLSCKIDLLEVGNKKTAVDELRRLFCAYLEPAHREALIICLRERKGVREFTPLNLHLRFKGGYCEERGVRELTNSLAEHLTTRMLRKLASMLESYGAAVKGLSFYIALLRERLQGAV